MNDYELLDRSTLETWASCPYHAKAIEDGKCSVMPSVVLVGNEVHDIISQCVIEYCLRQHMPKFDLHQFFELYVRESRPDIQPDVLSAIIPSAWALSEFITSIHPEAILAFDGGEDLFKGGQLASDFPELGVRVTSEIDFLHASPSPGLLHEIDYKTGWKKHSADDVAKSFQFQMHAMLILEKYPVDAVEITIWDTRSNRKTYSVIFDRKNYNYYRSRIESAINIRRTQRANPETWPVLEKCLICNAASFCPVADKPVKDIATDPAAFITDIAAVTARLDAMNAMASAYVDKYGTIECDTMRFGRDAPKAKRRSPAKLYSVESPTESPDD